MLELFKNAPARFRRSFGYAWDGLKDTFVREESFRLESAAFALLAAILPLSPWPWWKVAAMLSCYLLIPLAEALNSAIEDVCDLVTTERAPLVKNAKDKGALAVLLAIVLNAGVLVTLLLVD